MIGYLYRKMSNECEIEFWGNFGRKCFWGRKYFLVEINQTRPFLLDSDFIEWYQLFYRDEMKVQEI